MNDNNVVKFYEQTWFIIMMLILFFPVGLFLMWKFSNWNKVVKISVSVFIAILGILAMIDPSEYENEITYNVLSNEVTYEKVISPAVEAKYTEGFNLSKKYHDFDALVLYCGEDIPNNQELMLDYSGSLGTSIVRLQDYGAGAYAGKRIVQKQKFTCSEGKQIRAYNDEGTLTITGDGGELISPAKEEKVEKITETYTLNEDTNEEICYINNEESDCKRLEHLEELKQDLKETEITEHYIYSYLADENEKETCEINSKKVDCKNLTYIDKLKEDKNN
ncbi:MAG: hypothetical protein ACK5HS_01715 [Mycoplasmatales bacterium]